MNKKIITGAGIALLSVVALSACSTTSTTSTIARPSFNNDVEVDYQTDSLRAVDGVWDVEVVEVVLDADDLIATANEYTEPAEYGYILITIQGTNVSSDFNDLFWMQGSILGSDNVIYDEILVTTPHEVVGIQTEAAPGGTVTYQFAFDVPQSAVDGGFLLLGYDRVKVAL